MPPSQAQHVRGSALNSAPASPAPRVLPSSPRPVARRPFTSRPDASPSRATSTPTRTRSESGFQLPAPPPSRIPPGICFPSPHEKPPPKPRGRRPSVAREFFDLVKDPATGLDTNHCRFCTHVSVDRSKNATYLKRHLIKSCGGAPVEVIDMMLNLNNESGAARRGRVNTQEDTSLEYGKPAKISRAQQHHAPIPADFTENPRVVREASSSDPDRAPARDPHRRHAASGRRGEKEKRRGRTAMPEPGDVEAVQPAKVQSTAGTLGKQNKVRQEGPDFASVKEDRFSAMPQVAAASEGGGRSRFDGADVESLGGSGAKPIGGSDVELARIGGRHHLADVEILARGRRFLDMEVDGSSEDSDFLPYTDSQEGKSSSDEDDKVSSQDGDKNLSRESIGKAPPRMDDESVMDEAEEGLKSQSIKVVSRSEVVSSSQENHNVELRCEVEDHWRDETGDFLQSQHRVLKQAEASEREEEVERPRAGEAGHLYDKYHRESEEMEPEDGAWLEEGEIDPRGEKDVCKSEPLVHADASSGEFDEDLPLNSGRASLLNGDRVAYDAAPLGTSARTEISPVAIGTTPSTSESVARKRTFAGRLEARKRSRGRPPSRASEFHDRIVDQAGVFLFRQCVFCLRRSHDKSENATYLARHTLERCPAAPEEAKERIRGDKPALMGS